MDSLSVIIPALNEERFLPQTLGKLEAAARAMITE